MHLLGFDITRRPRVETKTYAPVSSINSGGWSTIWEPWAGAWQRNISVDRNQVTTYYAVYSCITQIASDIAKLRVKLVEQDADGIWSEVTNPAYSPVLRKPNRFQTRNQFWEYWLLSKLTTGNTYVLKERDERNVVTRLYVLDPHRVTPVIADDGSVFYELWTDDLGPGLTRSGETVRVPAREIIHDRFNCIFHPLIGTSPIVAAGLSAMQGQWIQKNSALFFQNRSMPSGILTAPDLISEDNEQRVKASWEANYGGKNIGRVAVLSEGMTFQPLTISATDSQLIEQLKMTAEAVCAAFHFPLYKVDGSLKLTNNNVQSLNVEYYSQCLQGLIEAVEEVLDDGLGIGWAYGIGTEFDVDNLLRMDTLTQMDVLEKGVKAGVLAPNEGRRRFDLKPVQGGDTPYLQQQNFSLAALDKRDKDDPFSKPTAAPTVPVNDNMAEQAANALVEIRKGFG
jgi:HK97 family phage portal protein